MVVALKIETYNIIAHFALENSMYCPLLQATNCFIFRIDVGVPKFSIFNFTSRESNENYLDCKSVVRLPQLLGDCNVEARSETALTHGEEHAHARK